jgi:hypothetical protein
MTGAVEGAAQELTLKSEDLALEVGTKRLIAFSSPDGKVRGEACEVVMENSKLGETRLVKIAQIVNGQRQPDVWCLLEPRQLQLFINDGIKTPLMRQELPVKIGQTAVEGTGADQHTVHVVRQEKITVPAGTFDCLVSEMKSEGKIIKTHWVAPRVGAVQVKGALTAVLMAIQKPALVANEPQSRILCSFDTEASPLFPKGRWRVDPANTNAIVSFESDPLETALGTAMSLRWRYHLKTQTWVQLDFLLTGAWQELVDLTPYDSISFYIKGLKKGSCAFMLHGQPVRPGNERFVNLPVDYTTEWQKVTVSLQTPVVSKLDLKRIGQLSFGHLGPTGDGNVIWVDEMTCHLKK